MAIHYVPRARGRQRRSGFHQLFKVSHVRVILRPPLPGQANMALLLGTECLSTAAAGEPTCYYRRGGCVDLGSSLAAISSGLLRTAGPTAARASACDRVGWSRSRGHSRRVHFPLSPTPLARPTFKADAPCPDELAHAGRETSASPPPPSACQLTSRTSSAARLYVRRNSFHFSTSWVEISTPDPRRRPLGVRSTSVTDRTS